jgi:SAM-dependent methyltransferase
MVSQRLRDRFYPGDLRNGTAVFYGWVREHTSSKTRLLNLGAGPPTRSPLRIFKGEIARVVGADIDPVVLHNDELDEAVVIEGGQLPLPDASFDLVVSDFTFEHVEHPAEFLAEACRVLVPGGSLFFRTPNRRHYVATMSRMTPHWFHRLVANRVRNLPADAHEPWPTFYRLNRPADVERAATAAGFHAAEIRMFEAQPAYLVFHTLPYLAGVAWERTVNRFEALADFRANLFGRLEK